MSCTHVNGNCSGACGTACANSCNSGCYGCTNECHQFCSSGCSVYCSGGCEDNCADGCSGNCSGDCKGDCGNNCTGTCTDDCANTCGNSCSGACDNGCSGEAHTDLYENFVLQEIIMAKDITDISEWIKTEATRRGNSPNDITFNIGDMAEGAKMTAVISNLKLANQDITPDSVDKDTLILKTLGDTLLAKVKLAYDEKMVNVITPRLYIYQNGDNSDITGGWQSTFNYGGTTTQSGSGKDTGTTLSISATGGLKNTSIGTKKKIDFSGYTKLYIHFKSITFAFGASNYGVGTEGFGISSSSTSTGNYKDLRTVSISRPSGAYGGTVTNVTGSCKISSLGLTNGYLYFVVVKPNVTGAKSPSMVIDSIWLE